MKLKSKSEKHFFGTAVGIGIAFLYITLISGISLAVPIEEWNRTFGGPGDDEAYSVQQTADGGYILAGYFLDIDEFGWLIKTNSNGIEQWNRTIGASIFNRITSAQQTADGGYILAHDYGSAMNAYSSVVKTDGSGNTIWEKYLDSSEGGYIDTHVQETKDGGFIISGYTCDGDISCINKNEGWLIKMDMNGSYQWNKTFPGVRLGFIQNTKDGGYIYIASNGLHKTDAYGNDIWIKSYNTIASVVHQTTDGGYILSGNKISTGTGSDPFLLKIDALGNQQWLKTLGTVIDDHGADVQQTKDGGYILAGSSGSTGYSYAWLLKTDSSGNQQWKKLFGGIGYSYALSVQQTSDGSYIVAGRTNSFGAGGYDAWLIKIKDSTGITVISPNGGENWARGTTRTLTWTSTGSPETNVKIELLKDGVLNTVITSSTVSDGSYSWVIPSTQILGTDYKIRVTSTTNPVYNDTSDNNFIISAAPSLGDLNGNGQNADAGDLVLMKRASIGEVQADSRYDLNGNGQLADAGDLVLMKRASIGEINLQEMA